MSGEEPDRAKEPAKDEKDSCPRTEEQPPVRIAPVTPKVGEQPGNLERREEWFRRRRR